MANNLVKAGTNSHCKEWNAVVSMILDSDTKIKDVITQYYNTIQGGFTSKQVFVRYSEFKAAVEKIQKQRLFMSDEQLKENDSIPQRREIREILEKIQTRLPKVAEAEKDKANLALQQLKVFIDYEDLDEDDIEDLVSKINDFYTAANDAMINIHCNQAELDKIKKDAKTISVALKEVLEGLKKEDTIDILMRFSKDPLSKVERLLSMLVSVNKDMVFANNDIAKRREKINIVRNDGSSTKYAQEKNKLETCRNIVVKWEV